MTGQEAPLVAASSDANQRGTKKKKSDPKKANNLIKKVIVMLFGAQGRVAA
jgi:hypothetical protein